MSQRRTKPTPCGWPECDHMACSLIRRGEDRDNPRGVPVCERHAGMFHCLTDTEALQFQATRMLRTPGSRNKPAVERPLTVLQQHVFAHVTDVPRFPSTIAAQIGATTELVIGVLLRLSAKLVVTRSSDGKWVRS